MTAIFDLPSWISIMSEKHQTNHILKKNAKMILDWEIILPDLPTTLLVWIGIREQEKKKKQ